MIRTSLRFDASGSSVSRARPSWRTMRASSGSASIRRRARTTSCQPPLRSSPRIMSQRVFFTRSAYSPKIAVNSSIVSQRSFQSAAKVSSARVAAASASSPRSM